MLKETSRLDEVFRADSNNCLWFFKSSLAAFSLLSAFFSRSTASSARITWKSKAFDLLSNLSQVATREVRAFPSSSAKVALASLDCWRDCSTAYLTALSSAREFSTLIRQTSHLTVLSALPSSHWLTFQIEKAIGQPKRSKERNSEGVKGLPS
jgi:hypothetical protein